jgi:hypothetical protein
MTLIWLSLFTAGSACAAHWYLQPAAEVSVGYVENPQLRDVDQINTTRYSVDVGLRGARLTERLRVGIDLGAFYRRFPGHGILDSDNLSAALTSDYRVTELGTLTLDASLIRDTTRTSELTTTGNITSNIPRNRIAVNPSWTQQLTERSEVGIGYGYERVTYEADGPSSLINYRLQTVDAFYNYRLNERATIDATITASSYDPDEPVRYRSYAFTFGLSYALSETLSTNAFLGPRRVEAEADVGTTSTSANNSGNIYGIGLLKQFERSRLSVALSKGLVPTGSGEPLDQERLTVLYLYTASPRLTLELPVQLYRNEQVRFVTTGDEETRLFFSTEPRLRWRITEDMSLTASYRYQYQQLEQAGTEADSNALFLSISYVWPTEGTDGISAP